MHEELAAEQIVRGVDASVAAKDVGADDVAAHDPKPLPRTRRLACARECRNTGHSLPGPKSYGV
jgi:hypothetical protein